MFGNQYYRVIAPKEVWIKTGSVPGNHYFGASRIYDVQGVKLTLIPGDELHDLVGGLFAVTSLGVFEVLHKEPSKLNMHFCKDYTPVRWYIDQMLKSALIDNPHPHVPVSYRV